MVHPAENQGLSGASSCVSTHGNGVDVAQVLETRESPPGRGGKLHFQHQRLCGGTSVTQSAGPRRGHGIRESSGNRPAHTLGHPRGHLTRQRAGRGSETDDGIDYGVLNTRLILQQY